jgi:hypothetical protein
MIFSLFLRAALFIVGTLIVLHVLQDNQKLRIEVAETQHQVRSQMSLLQDFTNRTESSLRSLEEFQGFGPEVQQNILEQQQKILQEINTLREQIYRQRTRNR